MGQVVHHAKDYRSLAAGGNGFPVCPKVRALSSNSKQPPTALPPRSSPRAQEPDTPIRRTPRWRHSAPCASIWHRMFILTEGTIDFRSQVSKHPLPTVAGYMEHDGGPTPSELGQAAGTAATHGSTAAPEALRRSNPRLPDAILEDEARRRIALEGLATLPVAHRAQPSRRKPEGFGSSRPGLARPGFGGRAYPGSTSL